METKSKEYIVNKDKLNDTGSSVFTNSVLKSSFDHLNVNKKDKILQE